MNRETLKQILGPSPDRCPLDAVLLNAVDCGSYTRETIEYAVEPGQRIRSFLLVPRDIQRPSPAVFAHHQHAHEFHLGKSEVVGLAGDPDQAYAAELAQRGYVVIAPDALGFEERNWSFPTGDAEYYELATRLVQGKTLLAKCLHDVRVGFDYLETRAEVDPLRMGFLGHSYGGRTAIWAPALDERILASVSNCGCVNYKQSFTRDAGVQMEFCLPDVLRFGDVEDVARLVAPRALRLQATADDKWSRGSREMFAYAHSAFPPGQLELGYWPGGHVFTPEMREAAYAFLARHLAA